MYAEIHDNDRASSLFDMGEGILEIRYLMGQLNFYSSRKTNEGMEVPDVFLIDEPEQKLHPNAVSKLVEFLGDFTKNHQVIFTTHSLQIVEDIFSLVEEEPEKHFRILTKINGKITQAGINKCLLPYVSASEINYVAFRRSTAAYFNELYGCLNAELASREGKEYLDQSDMEKFFETKGYKKDKAGRSEHETIFTYLRNAICHPENKKRSYQEKDLTENTEKLREIVKELKEESKNGEKAH